MNPTSEAYFTTDPLGPLEPNSPREHKHIDGQPSQSGSMATMDNDSSNNNNDNNNSNESFQSKLLNLRSSPRRVGPGSTHSRGSGTVDSPIAIEDDHLGTTRRLLFPSPRRDGAPKVLGELAVNVTQTNADSQEAKSTGMGKENRRMHFNRPGTPIDGGQDDEDPELFGTPPNRPSTPTPKSASSGVFKTPTRPTPSHRPITRSISRSIRSVRTLPKSPGQLLGQLLRTPSKTPRSSASHGIMTSTSRRRSPRHAQLHAHFGVEDEMQFDTPLRATLSQLISEANDFTAGSPSHGLLAFDINSLPTLSQLDGVDGNALDFDNYFSTDLPMPSSPPLVRSQAGNTLSFGGSLEAGGYFEQFEQEATVMDTEAVKTE